MLFKVSFSSSSSASSVKLDGIKFQKLILLSTFLYFSILYTLSVCDVHPSNYKYGCILHGNIEVLLKILLLAFIFYILIWILHTYVYARTATQKKVILKRTLFHIPFFVVSAIHHERRRGDEGMSSSREIKSF